MPFLSCSHPFIYGNIKQHLKLRPVFVFLACLLKPQVILFHFITCSLSNKLPIMAAPVIDSSSLRRVFVDVNPSTLPGMRKELDRGSEAASYTITHPCSPAAPKFSCFQEKWCLIWIQQTLSRTFNVLDCRLPRTAIQMWVRSWAGGDWPQARSIATQGQQAQSSRIIWFFKTREDLGFCVKFPSL